ncbi:hypothetical protein RhiirC2_162607 [Rhizophagus irregularis]|uniref:Uncharacterized protein n=1 Tax=Rhizophagus irregularis TaxID=588596 RepID=A0A2N1MMH2_9GLOM|nr:hypothetical protein RhiirC2_162607 [Rhizophagus irregularis]
MSDKKIHRYFLSRESSKWDIVDFLEESSEEPFEKKIDVYIKSLNNLANYKRGKQRERALTLIDKYKEGFRPDRQRAREWKKECKPARGISGPSFHFHKPKIVDSSVIGVNNGIYENKKSKKRKHENQEENARKRSSPDVNDQSMLYDKAITEISIAREINIACQTMPLCWGIIDLRVENVSPCPKHPRAKELLPQPKF